MPHAILVLMEQQGEVSSKSV